MVFDGIDDYLDNIIISDNEELTIQVVMKHAQTTEYRNIFDKYTAVIPMLWINPSSKIELNANYEKTLNNEYSEKCIVTTSLLTNNTSNLYINNVKMIDNLEDTKDINGTYQLFNRDEKQTYQGEVYSIRIYKRLLSEREVQHNYGIDKYRFDITE